MDSSIDKKAAKRLVGLNIRVKISLDGVTAGTHDFLRGKGSFERVIRSISLMLLAGAGNLAIHYTVHHENCTEFPKLAGFLSSIGVHNTVCKQ